MQTHIFKQTGGNPLFAHGLGTSVCKDQYAKMDCLWNKDRQHKENKGNKGTNRVYLGGCRASKKQELGEQNLELGDQKVGLLFRVCFCKASVGVFRSLKQACPSSFDKWEMNQPSTKIHGSLVFLPSYPLVCQLSLHCPRRLLIAKAWEASTARWAIAIGQRWWDEAQGRIAAGAIEQA